MSEGLPPKLPPPYHPGPGEPRPLASPLLALSLGVLPAFLAILGATLANVVPSRFLNSEASIPLVLIPFGLVSLFCCFASSIMLFKRGKALAIVGGILFIILNGSMAFFAGCVGLLVSAGGH